MDNDYASIMPLVRETFMADIPQNEIFKYQDRLKIFWMKTVDFFESNQLSFTKENLLKNADTIKNWEIGNKEPKHSNKDDLSNTEAEIKTDTSAKQVDNQNEESEPPCACKTIPALKQQINMLRKYGIMALVLIGIVLFATRSSSSG